MSLHELDIDEICEFGAHHKTHLSLRIAAENQIIALLGLGMFKYIFNKSCVGITENVHNELS